MNRVQQRCLAVSLTVHCLLVLLLIVGPAFMPKTPPPNDLPLLDVIPSKLVDDLISRGSAPGPKLESPQPMAASPMSAPAQVATPTPAPAQAPAPAPEKKEEPKETVKEPAKETQKEEAPEEKVDLKAVPKTLKPDDIPIEPPKTQKPKRTIVVDPKKAVTRKVGGSSTTSKEDAKAKARAEAAEQARADAAARSAWQSKIRGVAGSIRGGISGSVTIKGIGGGEGGAGGSGGGEAAANYAQAIRSIFDQAWYDPPDEVTDESLNVVVRITIARSGKVLSARVSTPSGNGLLDRSVRRALDRVDSVPAFPAGAKEETRSYTIVFNLKSKRRLG